MHISRKIGIPAAHETARIAPPEAPDANMIASALTRIPASANATIDARRYQSLSTRLSNFFIFIKKSSSFFCVL
jgi:hypothetical protein